MNLPGLAYHARSSVLWNAGFVFFRELLLKFGVVVIMRRLLPPEAYGQFNLVSAIIGFIAIFSFTSFVGYIVQVREERDAHLQDQFTAGGVIQLAMFGAANLVALVLPWLPRYASVAPLVHVMSLIFLCEWPCNFCYNYLTRIYNWKALRLLHGIGILLTQILALAMAYSGAGVYALLIPNLVVAVPFTWYLFYRMRWRPTWNWSWANYKPAWKFGVTRVGSGLAYNGRQLLESSVLVARLGFTQVGFIGSALSLAQLPTQAFAAQLLSAIYPVLTRVDPDPRNISRVNGLVLRLVAWVAVPLAVLFSLLAAPLVLTLYGVKWLAVIPLLPWAMAVGAASALAQSANTLLLAQGRLRLCLLADVLTLIGSIGLLFGVLQFGLKPYLAGVAALQTGLLGLMLFWLGRAGAMKWSGIVQAAWPAGCATVLAAAAGTAVSLGLGTGINRYALAAAIGTAFCAVYLSVLRMLFARSLRELVVYVPGSQYLSRILLFSTVRTRGGAA